MKLKKKNTPKRKKTSLEKEQSFVKITTNILLVVVIVIAVIVSFNNSFGDVDLDGDTPSLTELSALTQDVDTSAIISNQLSDTGKPALINKINASELDILTDDEFDYNKYSLDTIPISKDLSLSAEELGLIYSYLFVNHSDNYNTILYEISITQQDNNIIIKTVASIDFYKLFTSKVSGSYDASTINSLPKRIYVTNTATYLNKEYTYSQAKYNNLDESSSASISTLIKSTTTNVDLNKYVPSLIISMVENLSLKTSTTFKYSDNQITFKKGA